MTHLFKRSRPFPIVKTRVEKSPFASVKKVKEAVSKYKKREKIGFTYTSSLKAMGLIPRANGIYELSSKYRKLR
jgi:hypothetical protein